MHARYDQSSGAILTFQITASFKIAGSVHQNLDPNKLPCPAEAVNIAQVQDSADAGGVVDAETVGGNIMDLDPEWAE